MLTSIARLESSFDPLAKNSGSSALGYFQFLDRTRKDYDSSSREEFANDP
ncbi:MAG: transglycosylase SLT domain-containing protein [Candidatus Coprovivens sp.]